MLVMMFSKLAEVNDDVAETRAGAQWTCQTSSGSSYVEPNLERERSFVELKWLKPEREHFRSVHAFSDFSISR